MKRSDKYFCLAVLNIVIFFANTILNFIFNNPINIQQILSGIGYSSFLSLGIMEEIRENKKE